MWTWWNSWLSKKKYYEPLCEPLVHIINVSLSTGVFQNRLKKAIVKPIFRKENPKYIQNYFPIPLLSPLNQDIWISHLQPFSKLQWCSLIHESQHACRNTRSTIHINTYIIDLEYVGKSLEQIKTCIRIFFWFN